uniref:VWFD domain-containing protein n=1 Tax=Globisporangium ultimum (strain ATCC 200006 / CBS 805.95 / DAOM BR144) TaxID=431595 RepID=K3X997_GLOUD
MQLLFVSRVLALAVWATAALSSGSAQDGVIGSSDDADINTATCIQMFTFKFENGENTLIDGEVLKGAIVPTGEYDATGVTIQGIKGASGLTIMTLDDAKNVLLRATGGAGAKEAVYVDYTNLVFKLAISTFAKDLPAICPEILIKRLVIPSGSGGGVGDPHLTTLDHVCYDFQKPGVFRLFESLNFQVQVFQHKCTPTFDKGEKSTSCYQGAAIAFASAVVRFFIVDNKLVVAKGTQNTQKWLSVEKLNGKTEGYRVFTTADYSTYVDITLNRWIGNYPLLNIALRVSPYFKDPSVQGLLGNWNGKKSDDLKDNAKLAALHGMSLSDNLFTCLESDCDKFLLPPSEKDLNAVTLSSNTNILHQGFTRISESSISLRVFQPVVLTYVPPFAGTRVNRRMEVEDAGFPETGEENSHEGDDEDSDVGSEVHTQALVAARARELCYHVFQEMRVCEKYVTNTTNYIEAVCIGDAAILADLSIVDLTKLSYLRECRRELETRIVANASTDAEMGKFLADRSAFHFGDNATCAGNCSGQGACLPGGCACNRGVTGLACDLPTPLSSM